MRVPLRSRLRSAAPAVAVVATLALAACAPVEDDTDTADEHTATASADESASADECATDSLPTKKPGTLTIGTDSPAFEPWFKDNDPSNGEGFESDPDFQDGMTDHWCGKSARAIGPDNGAVDMTACSNPDRGCYEEY